MSVSELHRAQQHFLEQSRAGESSQPALQQQHQQQQEEFQTIILLVLHLVNLLCLVPPSPSESPSPSSSASPDEDPKMFKFRQTVHRLVKLGLTTPSGRSLLHLAVDRRTSTVVEEFYSNFPSVNVVKVGSLSRHRNHDL
jgi:hypothetical protein